MGHAISWFEIPVTDIKRATAFYEKILDAKMQLMEMGGMKSAFLPADMENGSIGGCLTEGEDFEPSTKGSLVYLNGGSDLNGILNRVEAAGGSVLVPKSNIGENGFYAHFKDSEGNKIGLHSTS